MRKSLVIVLAILSMVFWGMSFVWSDFALDYLSPTALIFSRLVISAFILFVVSWFSGKWVRIRRTDIRDFILLSFFTPFLYFIGETYGIKHTNSTYSSVVISTIPLFVAVVAWLKLGEKLKALNFLGIVLSFVGVLVMMSNQDFSDGTSFTGSMFLLLAVLSAILYTVYLKKLSVVYSAIFIITVQNIIGAVFFLPIFLMYDFDTVVQINFSWPLILAVLTLAIFCSSLAFIFFTISVKHLGVAKTDVYTNLIPVITALFSVLVLKEVLNLVSILGILLTVSGLFISQIKAKNSSLKKTVPTK